MPPFGPTSRKDLIRGKHSFMIKDDLTLTIPNPHKGDIGRQLLARILRQAGISRQQWEQLD